MQLGTANGSPLEIDLQTLIQTRLLIQASSGGGKSHTIRRIAEQAFGQVQILIIDPEGEFATLREKHGFVLVGKGGEAAADVRSAKLLARRLLELQASAVCDLSELKFFARHDWTAQFVGSLMDAPRELWRPVLVIVDEAHVFCPEKGSGESSAAPAMMDLCSRGRKRGFCAVFATQRLAKLAKNATAELQNVLIGRTTLDIDQKRAADALGYMPAAARALSADLRLLPAGTFYGIGRAIGPEVVQVQIGPTETQPPPSGSARAIHAPPAPAEIHALLPQLADLPKEAEESEGEVERLKRRVRELEEARPVVDTGEVDRLARNLKHADTTILELSTRVRVIVDAVSHLEQGIEDYIHLEAPPLVEEPRSLFQPVTPLSDDAAVTINGTRYTVNGSSDGIATMVAKAKEKAATIAPASDLNAPRRQILERIQEFTECGMAAETGWVALMCSTTARSRGFEENMRHLRRTGWIEGTSVDLKLTARARQLIPSRGTPTSAAERLERLAAVLSRPQMELLNILRSGTFGSVINSEQLATLMDTTPRARGFEENIRTLRKHGLIEGTSTGWRIAEHLR